MHGLMIFAAGLGTRMAPLTNQMPKPMIPLAGRPLLDYALEIGRAVNPEPIVVNTHYKGDQIRAHLVDRPVIISHEQELLDTGGGLKHAAGHFDSGPVFTLNPDVIWRGPNPLQLLMDAWDDQVDALLLTAPLHQLWGDDLPGDFGTDPSGRVRRHGNLRYLGAQIIRLETVLAVKETTFSLRQLWFQLIEQNRLGLCPYPGEWCDVGRPENIPLAEKMLRGGTHV